MTIDLLTHVFALRTRWLADAGQNSIEFALITSPLPRRTAAGMVLLGDTLLATWSGLSGSTPTAF